MQGQNGWGKFTWFYVLTSEIDNLCTIKGISNYFLSFGKAYVCKLAEIEKKIFTNNDDIIIQVYGSIWGILLHWLCQKPQKCTLLNTKFHAILPKSTLNNRHWKIMRDFFYGLWFKSYLLLNLQKSVIFCIIYIYNLLASVCTYSTSISIF